LTEIGWRIILTGKEAAMEPKMKLGDYLVAYLKKIGVSHLFGIPMSRDRGAAAPRSGTGGRVADVYDHRGHDRCERPLAAKRQVHSRIRKKSPA
jgi:hypothetical protein